MRSTSRSPCSAPWDSATSPRPASLPGWWSPRRCCSTWWPWAWWCVRSWEPCKSPGGEPRPPTARASRQGRRDSRATACSDRHKCQCPSTDRTGEACPRDVPEPPSTANEVHAAIRPLLRRSGSAWSQEDESVTWLGGRSARGSCRLQGAFGVDHEQEVGGRGELTVGQLGGEAGSGSVAGDQRRAG